MSDSGKLTVTLGGQEYTITPLPLRPSKEWRAKFGAPFQTLVGVIQQAPTVNLTSVTDVMGLVESVSGLFLQAPDLFADMLFAYSPALQADRERIEATATDEEAMRALLGVLGLAYPFGQLLSWVTRVKTTVTQGIAEGQGKS